MTLADILLLAAALCFAALFFSPRLLRSRLWQATVTPLASIIGSGFLVAGPILAHAAGRYAWAAMAGLCALGYLYGAAIRHNIAAVEPELGESAPPLVRELERASQLALILAYFVSVTYYLNLFAAFGLRIAETTDPFWIRLTATAVIGGLGLIGLRGGLNALERLELAAVGLKLAIIGGIFAALLLATYLALQAGSYAWHMTPHPRGLAELEVLLGLVILVQGFETSRYLGDEYDAATRIRTMRYAQWISTAIYVAFILLITPYFTDSLPGEGGETAIIDMLRPVASLIAPMLILVALASQLSAAVADMNGAGGLVWESSAKRLQVGTGTLITALAAIAITWLANIYEIIAYASKIFVAYYVLQSLQAALSARRQRRYGRAALFALAVAIGVAIIAFAQPVEA